MRPVATPLTPRQVYRFATDYFQTHLRLRDYRVQGKVRVTVAKLLLVLFTAAARLSSLSATCRRLRGAVDDDLHAKALLATLPQTHILLKRVHDALQGLIPKALRKSKQVVAFDLTLIPYYGQLWDDEDLYYRSKAKRGTCTFLAYATAYVVRRGQRVTVALSLVRRHQSMKDVLAALLPQVQAAGIRPRLMLLDREFFSVEVLRYLRGRQLPFLMPVVCRGRKPEDPRGPSGTRVFAVMKRSGWYEYTLTDAQKQKATVAICVKCRNRHGERGKYGREALVYAYGGITPRSYDWVKETYRERFGIETSYRQMNECRVRTTTTRYQVRLFYFALALLLRNVWVWLHYCVLSSPCRGGRKIRLRRLQLKSMLMWLMMIAVEELGWVDLAFSERPTPKELAG
jgi:Transposase DDE domain